MVQYTHMSQKTPIKTASKDILARAMAEEDIRVEHRADAPSAYFDVKNRVLGLPVWKDMDNSVYDMLVGHEVSHALHTPADGWSDFVNKNGTRQMFLNVVEDARIERLIKDKFPGLKRDFANAYAKLHGQDMFELAERDINLDMPLIDRLNLHFKIGLFGLETIPFTADEQQYVTRMAETKTFEEVMSLASDLYDLYKSEQEQEQPQEPEQGDEGEKGTSGIGGEPGESDESSDSDDGEGESGTSGESGDDESDESAEGDSGESTGGDDSGESMEDDTDDGESADSTATSGEAGDDGEPNADLDYDSYSNEVGEPGSTQRSFEQGIEGMRDEFAKNREYMNLVDPVLENIVADWKTIEAEWDGYHASDIGQKRIEYKNETLAEFKKFMNSSKNTVMSMVQAFQMKQAADASKRTDIAKTGVLDTVGMMNYKWSEDIFVKNEVHADGKNHGMVMYVDWSGSMCGILQDTVEQLLVLTEFCRKAGIPFDVYAFSSNEFLPNPENHSYHSDEYQKMMVEAGERKYWTGQEKKDEDSYEWAESGNLHPHSFSLLHFLSSDMNARQMKTALQNLWLCTAANSHSYSSYGKPSSLGLGCTPLNEAVICAMTQIPEFQRRHGVQIVNCVILSDGEGHGMGLRSYGGVGVLRDTKTGKTYECQGRDETQTFLECLRDRTGANLVGIRLHDSKTISNLRYSHGWVENQKEFEVACSEYRKMNFTEIPESSYDGYFLIKGNTELQTDTLEGIGEDASYTRLKNAFIKGGNNKKASRVIANRIVDIIAA